MKNFLAIIIATLLMMPLLTHAQVGVGSLTPTSMLHAADTVIGTASWEGSFVDIQNVSSILNTTAGIRFKVDDNVINQKYRAGIFFKRNTVDANGSLIFSNSESTATGNVTSTTNARMTITAAGLVGIGTTDPDHKLSVVSSDATTDGSSGVFMDIQNSYSSYGVISGIRFRNGTTDETFKGGIFYQDKLGYGRGDLIFVNNSTNSSGNVTLNDARMTIKNNGNIGIGTTDPQKLFHVYESEGGLDVKFESDNGNPKIYMDGTTGSSGIFFENSGIAKANIGYNLATDNLYFTHGQTIAIKNGFLGIGVLAPQYPIHVKAIGVDCEVLMESTSERSLLRMDGEAGLDEIRFQTNGTYKGAFGYNYDNDNLFLYHGGNLVFKNGNLGVGETNPRSRLHVLGDARVESNSGSSRLILDGSSGSNKIVFQQNGTDKAEIGYDMVNEYIYLSEDGSAFIQDGNVYADGEFKYSNGTKTYIKQIPATEFICTNMHEDDKLEWFGYCVSVGYDSPGDLYWNLVAPVSLPNGATVVKFTLYYQIKTAIIDAKLYGYGLPGTGLTLGEMAHCSDSGTTGVETSISDISIQYPTINNNSANYYIYLHGDLYGDYPVWYSLGCSITYTITKVTH